MVKSQGGIMFWHKSAIESEEQVVLSAPVSQWFWTPPAACGAFSWTQPCRSGLGGERGGGAGPGSGFGGATMETEIARCSLRQRAARLPQDSVSMAFVWLLAVALGHKGRDPGGCPGSQQYHPTTSPTTTPELPKLLPHLYPNHNCPRTSQTTSPPPANHHYPNHHQPVPVLVTELSRVA
ncbi:unnamed protein product [Arctogadus glacialis]